MSIEGYVDRTDNQYAAHREVSLFRVFLARVATLGVGSLTSDGT
jgi:hypothetical protein